MAPTPTSSKESSVTERLIEFIKEMSEEDRQFLLQDLEQRQKGKRTHYRKPFVTVVDYASDDGVYKDFIQNISAGGVFIETRIPFAVGQEISLTFPLPNRKKHIKILGEVVRSSDKGIGVRFKIAGLDQEATIRSLLEMI